MQSPKNILLKSDRCLLKVFADTVCIYLLYLCVTHQKCTKYHRCGAMCYSLYDERFVVLRPDSGWCWRTCLPSCVCGLEGDQGDC